MTIPMNKISVFGLLFLILGLNSCSGDRIFEEFQALDSAAWNATDSIYFDLNSLDLAAQTSLIAIRFNESYKFSNCYVRIISKDSSNLILENRLVNMPLFDSKSGKPLGKGFGNTITKYDTIPFPLNPRTSSVTLLQYMREDQLSGIEAVGFKILK
jgi:gliding motility-associated lipoprotein GldH